MTNRVDSSRVRDEDDEDDGVISRTGHTISFGSSSAPADPAPHRPSASPTAKPEGIVKICKACLTPQPEAREFCVECGQRLATFRTAPEVSYIGQIIADKFEITEFIDRGGMGEVYLAVNRPLGQKAAVKFLNKKLNTDRSIVMRFLNEAKSYCRVSHPNAVTLLEYGQHDDGSLYIITEFITGKSLSKTLKARGVAFQGPPSKVEGFPPMATFDDTCGNYIMMYEIANKA